MVKKNGKNGIVQDYCYVNSRTIKNNYPLSLTLDLIDMVESKKMFIKLDLQYEYNNMRIKKENKWKAAFTMPMGSYKSTMMFFSLTNLLAIFQAMMNNILREQINTGEVASYINNVLVGTDAEEEHDKVVEEVLKKMEETDLYMKPEKYVWKSRRVNFLGVEFGLERVWMEKEKITGIKD